MAHTCNVISAPRAWLGLKSAREGLAAAEDRETQRTCRFPLSVNVKRCTDHIAPINKGLEKLHCSLRKYLHSVRVGKDPPVPFLTGRVTSTFCCRASRFTRSRRTGCGNPVWLGGVMEEKWHVAGLLRRRDRERLQPSPCQRYAAAQRDTETVGLNAAERGKPFA